MSCSISATIVIYPPEGGDLAIGSLFISNDVVKQSVKIRPNITYNEVPRYPPDGGQASRYRGARPPYGGYCQPNGGCVTWKDLKRVRFEMSECCDSVWKMILPDKSEYGWIKKPSKDAIPLLFDLIRQFEGVKEV